MLLNHYFCFVLVAVVTVSVTSLHFGPSKATRIQQSFLWAKLLNLRAGDGIDVQESGEGTLIRFYNLKNGTCPYAARTWITLLELGLPFEIIELSLEDKDDWYLDINPRGKVPAIVNVKDGTVVYESAICNEYLSDVARELDRDGTTVKEGCSKLMPVNAAERAALRLLNDHVDNKLTPAQYTLLMNKDEEKEKELIQTLEEALAVLEASIARTGGPYLMGKDFSLADIHVLPFFLRLTITLDHFKGYKLSKEKFPKLLEWFDLCSAKESVKPSAKTREEHIAKYNRYMKLDNAFGGLNKNKK